MTTKFCAHFKRKHTFSDVLKCKYPFVISVETDVNKVRCSLYKLLFGKAMEVGMIQRNTFMQTSITNQRLLNECIKNLNLFSLWEKC
jgi:hypothetical protein